MSSASAIAAELRSGSWASGAPQNGADPCASIPGIVGWALDAIGPLRQWFDELLGDPVAVAGFANGWQQVETLAAEVGQRLTTERNQLAELDGKSVRKLRERYDDLAPIVVDIGEWSGAAASALRLASTIVTAVRQIICDFLVSLAEYAQALSEWSLDLKKKFEAVKRMWEAAGNLINSAERVIDTMFTALKQLGELLQKLQPILEEGLDLCRNILASIVKPIPLVGGAVSDILQDDPDVEELDPNILNAEQQAAYKELMDRGEVTSLADLLDQNRLIDKISGNNGTSISIQTVRRPDGSEYYLVNLPSTLDWGMFNMIPGQDGAAMNDWDSNVALMIMNDAELRTQYERAIMDAMRDAGVPPGADVVWSGFSQGGIMSGNLGARDAEHGYNTVGVVTNGSSIDNFNIPRDVPILQVQHDKDPVPWLDLNPVPNLGPNTDWVYGTTPLWDDGFAPHNAQTYKDTLQNYIDNGGRFRNDWSFLEGDITETYVGNTGEHKK